MNRLNSISETIVIMLAGIALYHMMQLSGILNTIVKEEVSPDYGSTGYDTPGLHKRR